jgi:parallel beta-helix repeat protein
MVARAIAQAIAKPVATALDGGVSSGVYLTADEFEALTSYDADTRYIVEGYGTYLGPTLIEAAEWEPAVTDYHVTKSGNDTTGDGSQGNPWLTIWKAFNTVSTSNATPVTIWVDAGTYTENAASGYLLFTKAFLNRVTVRGKPGTRPIVINSSGSYVIRPNTTSGNIRFQNLEIQSTSGVVGFVHFSGTALTNFDVVDCVFTDTNSKTGSFSMVGTSHDNVGVKRCIFTSAGAFEITISNATNFRVVGNDRSGVSVAHNISVSGTGYVTSNTGAKTAISLTGRTASYKAEIVVRYNTARNVVHTGGNASFRSLLNIDENTLVTTSGVKGVSIQGVTQYGTCNDNDVTSLGVVGIAWPDDGGSFTCTEHEIKRNTVVNTGTNGHAILVSTGSEDVVVEGNTTNASGGGNYALVLKGTSNSVTGNTFTGGAANGILIKDASECVVTDNVVYSAGAAAIALEFSPGAIAPESCTVTGNTFHVSGGNLYSQLLANIGAGNIVNNNRYLITGTGVWGALLGATVSSLANVRTRWSTQYDVTTNDNASTDS